MSHADISVTIADTAIQVTISGGNPNNFVNSDTKFFLDGANGDTYLIFNSTTNRIELFRDDIKRAAF